MFKIFPVLVVLFSSIVIADENKLPSFKLKDFNNKRIDLSTMYLDGPVAINVWNMSCEPCKKEMKYLNDFHIKYQDEGFKFISINIDSPRGMSKVKSYVKSMNWEFPLLSDPRAEFFRKTGGSVMPYLLLVNKDGSINPYLIFGLFPLATSCTIHAYYKCVKVRPILPITDPPALGGNGSTYIPVPMGQY